MKKKFMGFEIKEDPTLAPATAVAMSLKPEFIWLNGKLVSTKDKQFITIRNGEIVE